MGVEIFKGTSNASKKPTFAYSTMTPKKLSNALFVGSERKVEGPLGQRVSSVLDGDRNDLMPYQSHMRPLFWMAIHTEILDSLLTEDRVGSVFKPSRWTSSLRRSTEPSKGDIDICTQ